MFNRSILRLKGVILFRLDSTFFYLKVATNGKNTLHLIIRVCNKISLKNFNNNDLQFKRLGYW